MAAQRFRRDRPVPGVSAGFGSLYYTDCRPGHGLQGRAGFQFQAASPGVAPEAMPIVQRSALYEAPVRWMRERRPVADYPASLAHTAEGGLFATAAGRYVGREANGTREGNQFTHAVVTGDPADYGLVRPAQLWAAPWWAVEPAAGTELDMLAAHPVPGPLDTETVRDRVRVAARGEERLTALLSAIHHLADSERRRTVVIVGADPEAAACWIAAATLLLPRPEALRVSFKIFVVDGQYGRHDIIALHPEWAGRWADTGPGSRRAVFDLDRGRHTAVEPTSAACFWVPRFLAEDPYDVVDAVELAGQFARARVDRAEAHVEPTGADRLAAVVVAAGERLTTSGRHQEAADWLLTAPEEATMIARDAVLEAVLRAVPPTSVARTLVAAAEARGWASAAARIQRCLLTAEIGEALTASDGVVALRTLTALPPLPALDRPNEDREHCRAEIEAALRGAGPDRVPALLTVAHRHAVRPATANFRSAAYTFAAWWVAQADPNLEPQRWYAHPEALDWVRDVLRGALAGPRHAYAVEAVRARWWRPLWQEACDPGDGLDVLLMSVAYEHLQGATRSQLMRNVQEWAFARMAGGAHPSTVAWNIVFGERTPERPEAAEFLVDLVERGWTFSEEVGSRLCRVLEQERPLSGEAFWITEQVRKQGYSLPPWLAELGRSDDAMLRVDSLLDGSRDTALDALGGCSDKDAIPLYEELKARWPRHAGTATADECRAVAFTFVLATGRPKTEQQRAVFSVLLGQLAEVVAAMPKDVRVAVERSYPNGLGQPWWDWVSEVEPRLWSLRRRSGARSAKKPGKRGE